VRAALGGKRKEFKAVDKQAIVTGQGKRKTCSSFLSSDLVGTKAKMGSRHLNSGNLMGKKGRGAWMWIGTKSGEVEGVGGKPFSKESFEKRGKTKGEFGSVVTWGFREKKRKGQRLNWTYVGRGSQL